MKVKGLGARFRLDFGHRIGRGRVSEGLQIGFCGVGLGRAAVGRRDSAGFGRARLAPAAGGVSARCWVSVRLRVGASR